jgi:hypothetical protein
MRACVFTPGGSAGIDVDAHSFARAFEEATTKVAAVTHAKTDRFGTVSV